MKLFRNVSLAPK